MIDTNDLRNKINEIRKRDLGDLSLEAMNEWERQIGNYEQIVSLHDISQFKALLDEYSEIILLLKEKLSEQEIMGENDVRERQQWIADKRAFGKFVKKFAIPDLTQLKQEVEDNYKIYGKTTKD